MKKTMIAASIAAVVAAPAAFADLKISGMVASEMMSTDNGTSTTDAGNAYTDMVLSGSEDLGNGMKAGFKYHIYHDNGGATTSTGGGAADQTADTSVSLSGDFGTIIAGRMESLAESKMDAFANIEGVNALDLEAESSAFSSRVNSAVAYVTPTVGGFHAAVSTWVGNSDFNGANEILAAYSNAGLTVMASSSSADQTSGADLKHEGIAVSYKMGDFEVRYMDTKFDVSASTDDYDYDMIGVKYTMGNNSIALGRNDDEKKAGEETMVTLTHSMSKNVSVYASYSTTDFDAAGTKDTDVGLVGMTVKF
jgi:predicted porin